MASIRKKFSLITQLIVILSVIIFAIIFFFIVRNALFKFAFESLKNNANVLYSLVEKNYKLGEEIYKNEIAESRDKIRDYYNRNVQPFFQQTRGINLTALEKTRLKTLLQEYFKSTAIGKTGYFFIQNPDGEVLYHPNSEFIGKHYIRNGADTEFISWQLQKQNTFHEYTEYAAQSGNSHYSDRIGYQNNFKQSGISIVFTIEKSELTLLTNKTFFSERLKRNTIDAVLALSVGQHGYAYINNSNAIVIAHPKGSLGSDIRNTDFGAFTINSVNAEKAVREALSFRYFWKNPGEKNPTEKIMAYRYFKPNDWYIVVTAYPEDIYGDILKNIILIILIVVVATMAITTVIISLSSRAIVKSIVNISESLTQISRGQGDLTYRLEKKGRDETTRLSEGFNGFMEWINNLINKVKNVSKSVFHNTDGLDNQLSEALGKLNGMLETINKIDTYLNVQNGQVKETVTTISEMLSDFDKVAGEIENQSSAVEESSSAIQEMSANINNVTDIAKRATTISGTLTDAAKKGGDIINQAISGIHEMEESGMKIREIMDIISGIAEQTNLLAMNAAIEAAHAGEYGKGFAVVADEIRKLAESSAASSREISQLIRSNSEKIKNTVALAQEANTGLEQILKDVEETDRINTEISSAMIEQSAGAKEILKSMIALVEITEEIRDSIHELKTKSANVINVVTHLENNSATIAQNSQLLSAGTTDVKNSFTELKESSNQAAMGSNKLFNLVSVFKINEQEDLFTPEDTALIRNELKSETESMIKYFDNVMKRVSNKEITLQQAKEICGKYLLSQKVGQKGYFCGLTPQAKLIWHPVEKFVGVTFDINLPKFYFIRWMVKKETGYYEYIWWEDEKMPDGTTNTVFNEKILYQIYYEPFEMMIYATAYKTDFKYLLEKEKKLIQGVTLRNSSGT